MKVIAALFLTLIAFNSYADKKESSREDLLFICYNTSVDDKALIVKQKDSLTSSSLKSRQNENTFPVEIYIYKDVGVVPGKTRLGEIMAHQPKLQLEGLFQNFLNMEYEGLAFDNDKNSYEFSFPFYQPFYSSYLVSDASGKLFDNMTGSCIFTTVRGSLSESIERGDWDQPLEFPKKKNN